MVDQETRLIDPHEVIDAVDALMKWRVFAQEHMHAANTRLKALEEMIRSGSTPAQRLVPRMPSGPTVALEDYLKSERALDNCKQTASGLSQQLSGSLAKIEHLERERDVARSASHAATRSVAELRAEIIQLRAMNKELTVGMAALRAEQKPFAELAQLADSRLAIANNLRRDLNEMNLKLNGKTKALANSERDLAEAKAELRRTSGASAKRRALAAENEASALKAQLEEQRATVANRDRTVDALSHTVESLRQEIADLRDGGGGALDDEPALPGLE